MCLFVLGGSIWHMALHMHITYVFTVCLWELAVFVLLLLVDDMPLGMSVVCGVLSPCWVSPYVLWVHCVCLCAYHVCLCYLSFVYCTWLERPCGGNVFPCVRVCAVV